jgi:hypothetical protein
MSGVRLLLLLVACHRAPELDRACTERIVPQAVDCNRLTSASYSCAIKARSSEAIEQCLLLKRPGGSAEYDADPAAGCRAFQSHVVDLLRAERCRR